MKKIISLLMIILLVCALASCTDKSVDNSAFITGGKTDYSLVIDNRAEEDIADAGIKIVNTAAKLGVEFSQSHLPYPKPLTRRKKDTDEGCENNEYVALISFLFTWILLFKMFGRLYYQSYQLWKPDSSKEEEME